MAGNLAYFPFYVEDWLSSPDVTLMSHAQRGAYIHLLALCWASGTCSLPVEDLETFLATLPEDGDRIRRMFPAHPSIESHVTNVRLWSEREKAEAKSKQSRKAVNTRWGKGKRRSNDGRNTSVLRTKYHPEPEPEPEEEEEEVSLTGHPKTRHRVSGPPSRNGKSPLTKEAQGFLDFYGREVGLHLVGCDPRGFLEDWRALKKIATPRDIQNQIHQWLKSDEWNRDGGKYRPNVRAFVARAKYREAPKDVAPKKRKHALDYTDDELVSSWKKAIKGKRDER